MRQFGMPRLGAKISPPLEKNIIFALAQQAILLMVGALTLDGGFTLRTVLCAILAYSIGLLIVLARRNERLTPIDRIFIRWGFLMMWFVFLFVTVLVGSLERH